MYCYYIWCSYYCYCLFFSIFNIINNAFIIDIIIIIIGITIYLIIFAIIFFINIRVVMMRMIIMIRIIILIMIYIHILAFSYGYFITHLTGNFYIVVKYIIFTSLIMQLKGTHKLILCFCIISRMACPVITGQKDLRHKLTHWAVLLLLLKLSARPTYTKVLPLRQDFGHSERWRDGAAVC